MKDYDELLKYYELYETIGTGNCQFFFSWRQNTGKLIESMVYLGSHELFSIIDVPQKKRFK